MIDERKFYCETCVCKYIIFEFMQIVLQRYQTANYKNYNTKSCIVLEVTKFKQKNLSFSKNISIRFYF